MRLVRGAAFCLGAWIAVSGGAAGGTGTGSRPTLERVVVAPQWGGFRLAGSGTPFVPWGFNYDHDRDGRLLEDYWESEWEVVEEDFREMRALGANAVRIHLQVGRFLRDARTPAPEALARLRRLAELGRRRSLRLLITGLGCYLKEGVPPWYDALDERGRWEAQAVFWEAVARTCAGEAAVLAYDLMNEPVVPGAPREPGAWLGPPFGSRYHFVQFITLDPRGRPREEIARAWIRRLVAAIRRHDRETPVTVGLVPWSLPDRPGLYSGFGPAAIAPLLDFLSLHVYPERGRLEEALETLAAFRKAGKPVVIEETFPLRIEPAGLERFLLASRRDASGWFGFYWGKTPGECLRSGTLQDRLVFEWLELFQRLRRRFHRF